MPTKYDVFAKLIEKAPCKAKDLNFETPIYNHINSLIKNGWIKNQNKLYYPIKNKTTNIIFEIIKYSLKNGLNYNLLFSQNLPIIVNELNKNSPNLRPKKLQSNKENIKLLQYLEKNQFLLIYKKKPRKGIILKHKLIENILKLNKLKIEIKTNYKNIKNEILKIKTNPINPFEDNIFEFLSGSAQLEGSTITAGETKDLILNEIYPDKPKKDIQMVKNLNEAMYYIIENYNKEITPEDIKEINKLVMFSLHRNAGKYKINQNKIQGNPSFKTSNPKEVPLEINNYCDMLKKINNKEKCLINIGKIHNDLQRIHPFADGNSRTTRMILNWMLIKNNLPLLILKMGCFDEYMQLTKLSKKRDDERLSLLFYHILVHENLIN